MDLRTPTRKVPERTDLDRRHDGSGDFAAQTSAASRSSASMMSSADRDRNVEPGSQVSRGRIRGHGWAAGSKEQGPPAPEADLSVVRISSGMAPSRERIVEALAGVIDPELRRPVTE